MRWKLFAAVVVLVGGGLAAAYWFVDEATVVELMRSLPTVDAAELAKHRDIETRLAPSAVPLGTPKPREWLCENKEAGQTFEQYLHDLPVRRDEARHTIYVCHIGDITAAQRRVLDVTGEYLQIYFDSPVKLLKTIAVADIPDRAKRRHPEWGMEQLSTGYLLGELLLPQRPDDALGYIGFTTSDLWSGEDSSNFVFGMALIRERCGVWSIDRFGDPATDPAAFQTCLRRTLSIATHEFGHILTLAHCTAFECNMNGRNTLPESDRKPLAMCPVCLRKLCWNLNVEPVAYLTRLQEFCERHGLEAEADGYRKAVALMRSPPAEAAVSTASAAR